MLLVFCRVWLKPKREQRFQVEEGNPGHRRVKERLDMGVSDHLFGEEVGQM